MISSDEVASTSCWSSVSRAMSDDKFRNKYGVYECTLPCIGFNMLILESTKKQSHGYDNTIQHEHGNTSFLKNLGHGQDKTRSLKIKYISFLYEKKFKIQSQ